MDYQFVLNGNILLSGNIMGLVLIAFIALVLVIAIIMTITRQLRYNEGLKYEFITIIAHKFRTPLTSVKWLCETLLTTTTEQTTKEGLADMLKSTDRLIHLTGTLIELTNTDSETKATYHFEKQSLNDLVRGVTNTYKTIFHEKNLFLAVEIPEPSIYANIDKARIEFALQTLLENAHNYTPPGRNVRVVLGIKDGKAVISVQDNGIGFEPGEKSHIFEKFYRTQNAKITDTEGFGVGLFLAQTVVKRHNGKISAYSEGKDRGSTFQIVLPTI